MPAQPIHARGRRPTAPRDPETRDRHEAALTQARRLFLRFATAEGPMRARMLADAEFAADISGTAHWAPEAIAERSRPGSDRPYFSVDRLSQPIYSIVNQHRDSATGIEVQPQDQGADPETAEVLQGLIRNIEGQSRARLAYTWAVEGAVRIGRGYVRVVPEYVQQPNLTRVGFRERPFHAFDPGLFHQDLRIKRVLNPFAVYADPACEEPDYSDALDYFIVSDWPVDEYVARYGEESAVTGLDDFASIGDHVPYWFPSGHVRLAEHYHIDRQFMPVVLLMDSKGQPWVIAEAHVPQLQAQLAAVGVQLEPTPRNRRDLEIRQLHWRLLNGVEILREQELPGRWIPVVPVIGEELFVNGERDLRGIVRGAKQSCQIYDYQMTALIEAVGLIPKNPLIATASQLKGQERFWKNANVENYSVLLYNEMSIAGNLVPPPFRNPAVANIGPLVAAIVQADNDVKVSTRFYDASLGQAGPQESGRAISARQRQTDLGTGHYQANFRDITLSHLGRILIDLIPSYYDTERIARIIGADDQPRTVKLNAEYLDTKTGESRIHRMGVGTYDVQAQAGPGFTTKREQVREVLQETIRAAPQLFPLIGDLFFKALGLHDVAARLEKTLPPEVRDRGPQDRPPIPPEVKQQVTLLMQQHEALTTALEEAKRQLETQAVKAQIERDLKVLELDSKERIAQLQVNQKHDQALHEAAVEIAKLQGEIDQQTAEREARSLLAQAKLILDELHAVRADRAAEREPARVDQR